MLEFVAFDLITRDASFTKKQEEFQFMKENGFSVVPYVHLLYHYKGKLYNLDALRMTAC